MKNVVIINGHSHFEQSNANKAILEEVKKLAPNAVISLLSELYPDAKINIEAEQEKLKNADVIVWQFPIHWYSLPWLLKKWVDEVFTYGFAYGEGAVLGGKKLILSFTAASPEEAYQVGGAQTYPVSDFLNTHRQTANLCRLTFGEFVVSYDMLYMAGMHPAEKLSQIQEKAKTHAEKLLKIINE